VGDTGTCVSAAKGVAMALVMRQVDLVMLLLFVAMAVVAYMIQTGRQSEPEYNLASAGETPVICMDNETHDRVRALMLEGLDNALRSHIERLFTVWMKVVDDADQPARIRTGVQQSVHAWQVAREGVLKWRPMLCMSN
jgi:hypothetical protein